MAEKPTYEELEQRIEELEQLKLENKQTGKWQSLNAKILDKINKSEVWKDCIEEILNEIKQFTGFEAVAIRLRENEDFPYYVTQGFPPHFVEAERYLCTRDRKGEITRDSEGNPYVECMCGNVICGRTDASKVFFTEGGSFWCNNTSKLISETTDEDRQTRTRNRCNSEGYESVALFPLKVGREILGLLQINDMRPHRFTDDTIRFFEEIGISVGTAFSRKQAEEKLHDSQEQQSIFVETMNEGMAIQKDRLLTYANRAFCIMLGCSRDELIGRDVFTLFDEENQKILKEQMEKRREGVSEPYEIALSARNGSLIHTMVSPYSLYYEENEFRGSSAIFTDITKLKKAESLLIESERGYRTLFEKNRNPIAIIDKKGRYIDANSAFLEFVDTTAQQLIKKNVFDFSPPDKKRNQESSHVPIWEDGGTLDTEYFVNGSIKILQMTITPIQHKGIEAIVGVGKDITKRKKTEDQITASLKEKEVMLREIHHRVKNNMQVIISLLRMHTRRSNSDQMRNIFDDCRYRVDAMSLIHEALYQSEDLARIDFEVYIKKLCRHLKQSYGTSGKGITVKVDSINVSLGMDQGIAVGMVICELVSNAFKHAFALNNGGSILVGMTGLEGEEIELIVQDDGKGMPQEIDLLKPTSFGLKLTAATVTRELGGSIEVVRNGGTRFVIRFKCKKI